MIDRVRERHLQPRTDPEAGPGSRFYSIETSTVYTGAVEVCLAYDATTYEGYAPHLFALVDEQWVDVTLTVDESAVCGSVASLGIFAVLAADPTPPTIVPHVAGTLGDGGWYTRDVTVNWEVVDPQSAIASTSGCDTTVIDSDTAGATVTCTATSDGGTAFADVTVKRDSTPPTVTCVPTPSALWPPNGKLVPVSVAVTVGDALSGPGTFELADASTSIGDDSTNVVDFETGAADVEGLLRAKRTGAEGESVYELTYTARDIAGNEDRCLAEVVVPHDQRQP